MSDHELNKLLFLISKGNEEAFAELYVKTKKGVYSFLYPYFSNHYDTEDIMQNVYIQIRININQYQSGTNGRAWILQIAKNLALNEIKRRKNIVYTSEVLEPNYNAVIESNTILEIMSNILSKEDCEIIILHVLWGYKHHEIAKKYNCPVGTILSKYKRAIEKLKNKLKEE